MKRFRTDDEMYRDLSMAIEDVLTLYIGSGHAIETTTLNDEFINRLNHLSDYCGHVVRFFQFREEHEELNDDEVYRAFMKSEAER